ncbi:MAG: CpsD/CapB family tyrosine-protein kinase, partial [Ruminococcus sp.]
MAKSKIDRSIDTEALGFQIRESYKTARTNIAYSIIKKGCKKIAFTSSAKGEGKTVTAMNVASALAQQVDTKVLVIECDLRRPHVHSALKLAPTPGLTNYLNDECTSEEIIQSTKLSNMHAVCYGAVPPNPSELLASEAMADFIKMVEKDYDYIIFDTPPIGVVIDAVPIIKASDGV